MGNLASFELFGQILLFLELLPLLPIVFSFPYFLVRLRLLELLLFFKLLNYLLISELLFLLLLFFHLPLQLLFALDRDLLLLFPFVAVFVGNTVNVDVVVWGEASCWLAEDLSYSGQLEQEEGVADVADVKQGEAEDEGQLVLLVVSDEAHEGVLALVHQVLVLLHLGLDLELQLLVITPFLLRVLGLEFSDFDLLAPQEIDIGELRLRQEEDRFPLPSSPGCPADSVYE